MDREVIAFALCIFSGFPLTYLYSKLTSVSARHIFSIFTTSIIFWSLYSISSWIHQVVATIYVYYISYFIRGKLGPIICFTLLMAQMSFIHVGFQILKSEKYDQSSSFMVLVMKLSSFAWSVHNTFF
jgi:lysophospholipid acyltransferase